MGKEYLLRLSWPVPSLWQNRRAHWAERAKAIKDYRTEAWAEAGNHGVQTMPGAILEFTFAPPNRIRRDIQNMPATMKSAIDGIADAMGCDDRLFRPRFPDQFADPVKGGAVLIHIRSAEQ